MIMAFLLALSVLLVIFVLLVAALSISKAINSVFLGLFGNLYVFVKLYCIVKKLILVGIIWKLFKNEKAKKADEKAD